MTYLDKPSGFLFTYSPVLVTLMSGHIHAKLAPISVSVYKVMMIHTQYTKYLAVWQTFGSLASNKMKMENEILTGNHLKCQKTQSVHIYYYMNGS